MTTEADAQSLDIANASGFPFQIVVETLVHETEPAHNWRVLHREHGWVLNGDSGFIDLVLRDRSGRRFMVVECKRLREATWVFLPADGDPRPRRHVNGWVSWYDGGEQKVFGWCDLSGEPAGPEAPFCAMRGQDASGQRSLLERVGGELVLSTEALAREQRDFRAVHTPDLKIYANVIVTNAALRVARFKPSSVSLADGTISDAEFQDVPWVRFRKQLAAKAHLLGPEDFKKTLQHKAAALENTIFIVQANDLVRFLRGFSFDDGPLRALGVHDIVPGE
jgi:hypothetical protein